MVVALIVVIALVAILVIVLVLLRRRTKALHSVNSIGKFYVTNGFTVCESIAIASDVSI